jgi:hypothetical protein
MAYKFHKNSSLRCTFIWHNAVCSFHFRSFQPKSWSVDYHQTFLEIKKVTLCVDDISRDKSFITCGVLLHFSYDLCHRDVNLLKRSEMKTTYRVDAGGVQRGRVSVVFLQICLCKWTWKKISANISTTRLSLFCILQSRKWLGINL